MLHREVDVRGTYTVISIASMLNMLTPQLAAGVVEYLLSCQTYEGGFGGETDQEAHGGYVFCAFAALIILSETDGVDLFSLQGWIARRQMSVEGGFQGRTNKLVDGCYSFWQGATAILVEMALHGETETRKVVGWRKENDGRIVLCAPQSYTEDLRDSGVSGKDFGDTSDLRSVCPRETAMKSDMPNIEPSCHVGGNLECLSQHALQRYILHCAQALDGGLRDKPDKPRDFYHTCYNLSGLSCAQWGQMDSLKESKNARGLNPCGHPLVYGDIGNLLVSRIRYNTWSDSMCGGLRIVIEDLVTFISMRKG